MAASAFSHLSEKDFDMMSAEDLEKISNSNKYKSTEDLINDLSPDALNIIAAEKSPVKQETDSIEDSNLMSKGEAFKTSALKGISLNTQPIIGGLAGGLGAMVGTSGGLKERLAAFGPAYQESRSELLAQQDKAAKDRPGYSIAGELVGSAATLPLTALQGLRGAVIGGAIPNIGQAVSEDKNVKEVIEDAAKGGIIGAGGFGLAKAAPHLLAGAKSIGGEFGSKLASGAKTGFSKVASALTGETEKNIRTYVDRYDKVQKLIKSSGGDVSAAADQVREKLQKDIQTFRQAQGNKIGSALEKMYPDPIIQTTKITDALNNVKSRINAKLDPEAAGEIDDLIGRINALSDNAGSISLKEVHDVQKFLQDRAAGSYQKGGQFFIPGKNTQQAAKAGAREAKIILDNAVPELKEANTKLFQLHKLEENINKNLIAPGKSEAALLAAGGATTGRNRKSLEILGKTLGKDVIGEAENLAASAAFGNQSLMPRSMGGTTSTSRTITGLTAGTAAAGPIGAIAGAVITSPVALKKAIQAGQISKKAYDATLGKMAAFTGGKIDDAIRLLDTPRGVQLFTRLLTSQENKSGPMERRLEKLNQAQ